MGTRAKIKGQKMTKRDILDAARSQSRFTREDCSKTFETMLNVIRLTLKAGATIEIRGFCTFVPRTRKARIARNPRTGVEVMLPERRVVWGRFPVGFLK